MTNNDAQKPTRSKRFVLKLVLFIALLVIAAVIGLQFFKAYKKAEFLSHMPEPVNPVTVMDVQTRQWTPAIEATGIVRPNQGAMLSSQSAGTVKAILVSAGQQVNAGDLLIELDSEVEKANLASLQAQLPAAQANFQRFSTLLNSKSVSKSDFDKAQSSYKTLQANIAAAKASLARRQIYAPFSGTVGIIQVNVGEYVTIGKPMVRVEDISKSKIDFSLGQNELQNLHIGQKVTVTTDAFTGETFEAKISAIEPAINANSGLVQLQASVENTRGKLLSGMFARLRVALNTEHDQVVLPKVAITYNMYGETVYRLTALSDEDKAKLQGRQDLDKIYRVELVTVHTIDRYGIYAHIKSGALKFGDKIVTGGQQRLSNGGLVVVSDQSGAGTEQPAQSSRL